MTELEKAHRRSVLGYNGGTVLEVLCQDFTVQIYSHKCAQGMQRILLQGVRVPPWRTCHHAEVLDPVCSYGHLLTHGPAYLPHVKPK